MKIIKVLTAALMAVLFSVTAASCKKEKDHSVRSSKNTEIEETETQFDESKYYVMIGTPFENDDYIRLRYFYGDEIMAVVWKHTPKDYEYGDVFVAKEGVEPEHISNDDGPYPGTYLNVLGADVELEKIGNCEDLMDELGLKVTSADYDGYGHWSIHLVDEQENEYYYGFVNDAYFDVDLTGAEAGEIYVFAMNDGKVVVPLEQVEIGGR